MWNPINVVVGDTDIDAILRRAQSCASPPHRTDENRNVSLCCSADTISLLVDEDILFNIYFLDTPPVDDLSMKIIDINSVMRRIRRAEDVVEVVHRNMPSEINQNAVLLHDIDHRWYTVEEDAAILTIPKKTRKPVLYDDTTLNFSAIHREAQKFNDCTEVPQIVDAFWMQSLLNNIISYFNNSWCDLTINQRFVLSILKNKTPKPSLFHQLYWVGYDCIIRSNHSDMKQEVAKYNQILRNTTGEDSKKNVQDLAVDFALSSPFTEDVIDACDKHFEKCSRKRMPYTKMLK